MCGSKKYEKNFYGYVAENLEDDTPFIIEIIGSLKKSENKKISDRIKIMDGYVINENKSQNSKPCDKQKKFISINKKIIISHHKPKNKKIYFGSKTNRKSVHKKIYFGSKTNRKSEHKKIYNVIPSFGRHTDTKNFFKKKKID